MAPSEKAWNNWCFPHTKYGPCMSTRVPNCLISEKAGRANCKCSLYLDIGHTVALYTLRSQCMYSSGVHWYFHLSLWRVQCYPVHEPVSCTHRTLVRSIFCTKEHNSKQPSGSHHLTCHSARAASATFYLPLPSCPAKYEIINMK